MPPRLNKRQLRELEELSALASPGSQASDGEAKIEEEFTGSKSTPNAGFTAVSLLQPVVYVLCLILQLAYKPGYRRSRYR
jgi:hypothetical protein